MRISRLLAPASVTAAIAALGLHAGTALAANGLDFGMFEISNILTLQQGDPRTIAVRLINVSLEFLGILTLVMILWGGVLFLFSGGKQEAMDRAGAVIKNAIIGLIIILSAWSIVKFVLTEFINATFDGTESNAPAISVPSSTKRIPL